MRVCAYCLMPNHFHLVLWPTADGQLSRFMQWLSMTHAQRRHAHRHSAGRGHLYQSRFKSFVIQEDGHFLSVCRYVERNAVRANLVKRAERWRWGSLWVRENRRQADEHNVGAMADADAAGLGWPGESAAGQRGTGRARRAGSRATLWARCVGAGGGQAFGDRKLAEADRPAAEETEKRLMTPLPIPAGSRATYGQDAWALAVAKRLGIKAR